jgi:hypothetical protein
MYVFLIYEEIGAPELLFFQARIRALRLCSSGHYRPSGRRLSGAFRAERR